MNIRSNLLCRLSEGDCKPTAFKVFRKELVEIGVIAGKVLVVLHQVVVKRRFSITSPSAGVFMG